MPEQYGWGFFLTAMDELSKHFNDLEKRIAIAVRYAQHSEKNAFANYIKRK